jgi:hypothetical protein
VSTSAAVTDIALTPGTASATGPSARHDGVAALRNRTAAGQSSARRSRRLLGNALRRRPVMPARASVFGAAGELAVGSALVRSAAALADVVQVQLSSPTHLHHRTVSRRRSGTRCDLCVQRLVLIRDAATGETNRDAPWCSVTRSSACGAASNPMASECLASSVPSRSPAESGRSLSATRERMSPAASSERSTIGAPCWGWGRPEERGDATGRACRERTVTGCRSARPQV